MCLSVQVQGEVPLALQAQMAEQADQAHLAQWGQQVHQAGLAHVGPLDYPGGKGKQEAWAHQAPEARLELLVPWASKEVQVRQGH